MSLTELEQLVSQGEYVLPIHGYTRQESMRQGEGGTLIVRSEIGLKVHAPSSLSAHGPASIFVRVVGPATKYDLTNDGKKIIGIVRRVDEMLDIAVLASEAFLSNLGTFLSAITSAPCQLSLTTKSKLEEWDGKGWVAVLEVALVTKVGKEANPRLEADARNGGAPLSRTL